MSTIGDTFRTGEPGLTKLLNQARSSDVQLLDVIERTIGKTVGDREAEDVVTALGTPLCNHQTGGGC